MAEELQAMRALGKWKRKTQCWPSNPDVGWINERCSLSLIFTCGPPNQQMIRRERKRHPARPLTATRVLAATCERREEAVANNTLFPVYLPYLRFLHQRFLVRRGFLMASLWGFFFLRESGGTGEEGRFDNEVEMMIFNEF
ncbi:hypothetical protein ACLOJK_015220 [Asimina triloba]